METHEENQESTTFPENSTEQDKKSYKFFCVNFLAKVHNSQRPNAMFKWVWGFTLLANVQEYLTEVAYYSITSGAERSYSNSRFLNRLLFVLLLLKLIHLFYLMFVPLDSFSRLLHFDFVHLFGCPQLTNILPVTVCAVIMFILYTLYPFDFGSKSIKKIRPLVRVSSLVEKVYFRCDESVFLFKHDVTGTSSNPKSKSVVNGKMVTSVEAVQNRFKVYIYLIRYQNDFIIAHYVFFSSYLLFTFISQWDFYLATVYGFTCMLITVFAEGAILLLINSASAIISAVSMINYVFALIVFKRFRQAEALLNGNKEGKDGKAVGGIGQHLPQIFNFALFGLFARQHTQTLLFVLFNNHAYGRAVTAFIFTFVISNSYLTQLISKGDFNFQATVFFGNYVILQWVLISKKCGINLSTTQTNNLIFLKLASI